MMDADDLELSGSQAFITYKLWVHLWSNDLFGEVFVVERSSVLFSIT